MSESIFLSIELQFIGGLIQTIFELVKLPTGSNSIHLTNPNCSFYELHIFEYKTSVINYY